MEFSSTDFKITYVSHFKKKDKIENLGRDLGTIIKDIVDLKKNQI